MRPTEQTSVLLVEDNLADARYVKEMLRLPLYKVTHALNLAAAHECISDNGIGIVLLDLTLPDGHGLESCLSIIEHAPETPIVILTGLDDEDTAFDAVKLGAQDYLLKRDISESSLSRCIRYAVERKRAEDEVHQKAIEASLAAEQAREAEANLKLSLRASKTGVWSWDILPGKVKTDDQVAAIFGVAPGTFGNDLQDWLNHIHIEDRADARAALETALNYKREYNSEFRIVWPDGSIHYIASRGEVLEDAAGVPVRVTGVCTDVTRQRNEQENAKRLAVLEQHHDFIATLTHDMKNPLIGADRLLDMFVEGKLGRLEAEQLKLLVLIREANTDVLALIQNLLDVYRFDEGATIFNFTEVDVATMANTCANQLGGTAQGSNVAMRAHFPEGDHTIAADSSALRRVLMNLLGNAIKFTNSGGSVTVSGRNLGNSYVLEVEDTGSGIAPEDVEKLFRRFSQTDLGKKVGTGTGLGLYLCRQLVEGHGGRITCRGKETPGTIFSVVLPTKH